ncbi:hypothetical protein DFQ30_008675 [Apophysomyces sp. BC1015]|nr:hypothetical protein DFQ30_008675 [Apophysomyces sp. BC1015]
MGALIDNCALTESNDNTQDEHVSPGSELVPGAPMIIDAPSEHPIPVTVGGTYNDPPPGPATDPVPTGIKSVNDPTVYVFPKPLPSLPRKGINEKSMSSQDAYQLIKSDLSMDANPEMHLGTYLTTEMDDEALCLMNDSSGKNFMDYDVYPETHDIAERCKRMIATLFNAPGADDATFEATGCSTIGSSEAIILGILAMKMRWKKNRKDNNMDNTKPNIVFGQNAHICLHKAARYLEIEPVIVPVNDTTLCLDAYDAVAHINENTIGVGITLGDMLTGKYEDVEKLNQLIDAKMHEEGWDAEAKTKWSVGIHVDAAT